MKIENTHDAVCRALHSIYERHRRKYRGNPDSGQMCCMWSTCSPPDVIEGTRPIRDIEVAFGISIDEEDALRLYDMDLDEAACMIAGMMRNKDGGIRTKYCEKEEKCPQPKS